MESLYVGVVLHIGAHTMGRRDEGVSWMKQWVSLVSRRPNRWANLHISRTLEWWKKSIKKSFQVFMQSGRANYLESLKLGKVQVDS